MVFVGEGERVVEVEPFGSPRQGEMERKKCRVGLGRMAVRVV